MKRANMQLTDYDTVGRPGVADLAKKTAPLSALLTQELDGAAGALGVASEVILVAALGRAIERTIGSGTVAVDVPGFGTSVQTMKLSCAAPGQIHADDTLAAVHRALEALSTGHTVHAIRDDGREHPVSDVLFVTGAAAPARAHLGHLLELRAYRDGDVMVLDWWFDTRSFEAYTVHELAEQFPLVLIELTGEATPPIVAAHELAMAH